MDANFNCRWVGAWNRKSKGGPEVRFALFRGLSSQFYGKRWRSEMMKIERKKGNMLESALFPIWV